MSVMLKTREEVDKLSTLLCEKDFINQFEEQIKEIELYQFRQKQWFKETIPEFLSRLMWYCYLGNRFAFNVMYEKNELIDYSDYEIKLSKEDKEIYDLSYVLGELRSLEYNLFTNAGTSFIHNDWVVALRSIVDMIDEKVNPKEVLPEGAIKISSLFKSKK